MIKPKFPTKYIAFTQYFSSKHQAVDIANDVTVGIEKFDNKDVFMAHEGKIITNAYASDYGYFIEYEVIDGEDRYIFADGHFDKPSELKVGETYPQGTFINRMGNSGTSAGVHNHHRITLNGVRVNPLDYEYVYPDQVIGSKENAQLKYYTPTAKDNNAQKSDNIVQNDTSNSGDCTVTATFEVGDKVLVLSGYATEDSYGGGSHTAEYDGNINDLGNIKYITKIAEGNPRAYHLSNGTTLGDGDRGWVSKEQIKKI